MQRQKMLIASVCVCMGSVVLAGFSGLHQVKADSLFVKYTLTCTSFSATAHTDQPYGTFVVFDPDGSGRIISKTVETDNGFYTGVIKFSRQTEGTLIHFNTFGSDAHGNYDGISGDDPHIEKCPSSATPVGPTPTLSTPTVVPGIAAGNILLADDFSDVSNPNGWQTGNTDKSAVTLAAHKLNVTAKAAATIQWAVPAVQFPADVDVTVTAKALNPNKSGGWAYGIGLRAYQTNQQSVFDYFSLANDGTWTIAVRLDNKTPNDLLHGKLSKFDLTTAFTLRAVAVGSHFDYYVNGAKVGAIDDGSLAANKTYSVALVASTTATAKTISVDFTNLKVVAAIGIGTLGNPIAASCKLPQAASRSDVGLGFPRNPSRLASTGTIKAKVLFADFSDAPAEHTPQQIYSMVSPGAQRFFKAVSYGRMDFQLDPYFVWIRLSKPSSSYTLKRGQLSYESELSYMREVVALADPMVDFSDRQAIYIITDPDTSTIDSSASFNGLPQFGGITADGTTFYNGAIFGSDLRDNLARSLNHEAGHGLGLVDLYSIASNTYTADEFRFTGAFDIMSNPADRAPEYFAYERWLLGWLDDSQVFCQQTPSETVYLNALEKPGGIKTIIVPFGRTSAVVIESRRALGYDISLPKNGALVYTVNTSISTGNGPIQVLPENKDPTKYQSPLAAGQQLSFGKITIKVIQASGNGDTVQVTVAN